MTTKRTITVRTFLDALIKNGYPWTQGYFQNNEGASCAVGQAMRNLGYDMSGNGGDFGGWDTAWSLADALSSLLDDSADDTIISFNDHEAASYQDVIAWAEQNLGPYSDREITYVEYTSEV